MAAPSESRFITTDRQTLLENGIATLTTTSGTVMIERAVTTYQRNSFGDADASYLDSETLHTLAYASPHEVAHHDQVRAPQARERRDSLRRRTRRS